GSAYRGVSLGLPPLIEALTWKTFVKAFVASSVGARVQGWNVRLMQTGVRGPSVPRTRAGVPVTFGHFAVKPDTRGPGLLLDYGSSSRNKLPPLRWLRDPIVAVNAGSAKLLLGRSYLQWGARRWGTPSYFTLEHEGPVAFVPPGNS